jgi:hypothetical protein
VTYKQVILSSPIVLDLQFFGSTNIKPAYIVPNAKLEGITDERLIGAQFMLDMGYSSFKFLYNCPGSTSLADMMDLDPYKRLFDMPIKTYVMWVTPCSNGSLVPVADPTKEYRDFFTKLKVRYRGTGKTFYMGGWEQGISLFNLMIRLGYF